MPSVIRVFLIFIAITLCSATPTRSEVIEQPEGFDYYVTNNVGQSFTATINGHIKSISVTMWYVPHGPETYNGELLIYHGANGSNEEFVEHTPAYRQTVSSAFTENPYSYNEFILNIPFPIEAGQSYTFIFTGNSNLLGYFDTIYPGGHAVLRFGYPAPDEEVRFKVTQTPPPIPTTSEWTLLLLGLTLVGGTSILLLRRRTQAA